MAWLAIPSAGWARDVDELGKRASWTLPGVEQVRGEVQGWLEARQVDAETRKAVEALWADAADAPNVDLLELLARSLALADESARRVVEMCAGTPSFGLAPQWEFLHDEQTPPLVRHNLRLLYGRWLAQYAFYDEAQRELAGLVPGDVVDPASLLFHQSVVHHRLLEKEDCLAKLTTLLENEAQLPKRYATVARLMEADIRPLKTDSLDEIARLMQDIERRLKLARAGTRVRQQEDDVIAKLDKMIKQIEEQQKQQQQQSSGAQGGAQSNSPAQDSMPLGGRGPGDVDQKKIGHKSSWGNLPPKERQEALQQISKDLPAHFRDVVEEYFRRLARDTGSD